MGGLLKGITVPEPGFITLGFLSSLFKKSASSVILIVLLPPLVSSKGM